LASHLIPSWKKWPISSPVPSQPEEIWYKIGTVVGNGFNISIVELAYSISSIMAIDTRSVPL
jgi:hypothetical protein